MKRKIYDFLVNRHIGINRRYHKVHDNSTGLKKIWSWIYLLWTNFAYYILFCRFLGDVEAVKIYEEKKLVTDMSESEAFAKSFGEDLDSVVNILSSYDIISFDIFDTLIFRPFSEPTDLFYHLGDKLGFMDFKRIRMEAEQKARLSSYKINGHYEVELEDIWNILSEETGIDKCKGMELEIELEKEFCHVNPFMKKVYDSLIEKKKKIIIISDMYMSKDVLSEILETNGYTGMEKVFVSCESGKNKASGSLYDHVKKELGITRGNCWIHIGDNVNSDILKAKEAGVVTLHYPNVNKLTLSYRPYDMSPIVGGAYRGIVNNHIYNGLKKYTMEYEYGYIYGGLFALGYCSFIHDYCEKNSVDKVLFLSRDGDVLKQVYEKIYPKDAAEYIYWSRRAATKLMANSNRYDYFRRFIYHKINSDTNIRNVLKGMELECLCECLPEMLLPDDKLTTRNADILKEFLVDNWSIVQDVYENEHRGAQAYFKEHLGGCKKVCAVDIGWAGSGAVSIQHLVKDVWKLQCDVIGIIAGTNTIYNAEPDASETFIQSGKLVSYMYSSAHNRDLMKKHNPNENFNVYWELLLSSPTKQFNGFDYDEQMGVARLIFGASDANEKGIRDIQQGILDFVSEYHRHFGKYKYMYNISGRDAYAPMLVAAGKKEKYLKEINRRFQLQVNIS